MSSLQLRLTMQETSKDSKEPIIIEFVMGYSSPLLEALLAIKRACRRALMSSAESVQSENGASSMSRRERHTAVRVYLLT